MSRGSNSSEGCSGLAKWLVGTFIALLAAGGGIVALLNYVKPPPPTPRPPSPVATLVPTRIVTRATVIPLSTPQTVIYTITLFTGCIDNAGTDASVYIRLSGAGLGGIGGSSPEVKLDIPNYDDRQKCAQDSYPVTSKDLGFLNKVEIRHDNSNDDPGWFLERVQIVNSVTGQKWEFPCHKWLEAGNGNLIFRTIKVGGPCS